MTKKQFIKAMKDLILLKRDEENLSKAIKRFEPDFNYICFSRYENLVLEVLKIATGDKDDWISYWLYELDCGTKAKKNSVKSKYGKGIPIKTLSDLFNIIEDDKK